MFGGAPKGAAKAPAVKAPVAKKTSVKKKSPVKKVAPKDSIPVLSRWKQNADGSITGNVSNSSSFKNGTKITTSPVAKGAKTGIVKTGSGSQYRLS